MPNRQRIALKGRLEEEDDDAIIHFHGSKRVARVGFAFCVLRTNGGRKHASAKRQKFVIFLGETSFARFKKSLLSFWKQFAASGVAGGPCDDGLHGRLTMDRGRVAANLPPPASLRAVVSVPGGRRR